MSNIKEAGYNCNRNKIGIIKVLEGLPNLLRGFCEGFTIKTSIVVEGSS